MIGMHAGTRFVQRLLSLLALVVTVGAIALPASAVELAGVKLDDSAQFADRALKLNGAGIRYKLFFKVYAAGLYLTEKKTSPAEILALSGPKRVQMVMLRDLESEALSKAFGEGIEKNTDAAERAKIASQLRAFERVFATVSEIKKGDVLTLDWQPGLGTTCQLNGKRLTDAIPDIAFYNAVLKIWLGEQPADAGLKSAMLGNNP